MNKEKQNWEEIVEKIAEEGVKEYDDFFDNAGEVGEMDLQEIIENAINKALLEHDRELRNKLEDLAFMPKSIKEIETATVYNTVWEVIKPKLLSLLALDEETT